MPLPISSNPRLGDRGQRQTMINHPNRNKRTKTIRLTDEEIFIIKHALRIASEDGSIYGDSVPGDDEFEETNARIDSVERKLREAS